jgi:uncharacterized short protein YbdD (DUF466 family)
MTQSEKFINWLEGYLDACKNSLTPAQIREVRKKLNETRKDSSNQLVPIYDNYVTHTNNHPVDEEFIKAIEENKNASTLEELFVSE